jgi:hypothetical protein
MRGGWEPTNQGGAHTCASAVCSAALAFSTCELIVRACHMQHGALGISGSRDLGISVCEYLWNAEGGDGGGVVVGWWWGCGVLVRCRERLRTVLSASSLAAFSCVRLASSFTMSARNWATVISRLPRPVSHIGLQSWGHGRGGGVVGRARRAVLPGAWSRRTARARRGMR